MTAPSPSPMAAMPARVRHALAWGLGVATACALPPLHLVFLLIPAFSGLVLLARAGGAPRAAFWAGWWFGFGYFGAGLYWISFALLVDAAQFAWLIPVAVLGLGGGFALFPAVVTWGARRLAGEGAPVLAFAAAFAALWTLSEGVRAWLFTGFPWNPIASVWAFSDAALQPAAWIGGYGVGLASMLAAATPAALVGTASRQRRTALRVAVLAYGVLGVGFAAGWARLPDGASPAVDGVRLRLVQPNIAQGLKWKEDRRWAHVVDQAGLGAKAPLPGEKPPTHVIWAETAAPLALNQAVVARQVIGANTPPGGLSIVGAIRTTARGETPFRVWNSLYAVRPDGSTAATYDKFHLVPFGEYMPFGELLGLKKITAGRTDFSAGPGPVTLRLDGLPPVSPLICYEIIFPRQATDPADRPDWILNLTNDGWYGRTPGPHQHFVQARLRAIEEGLPVVRVANTGISGVIDAFGRVVASLPLGARGTVDSDLPRPLVTGPTLYARTGSAPVFIFALVLAAGAAGIGRRQKPHS